MCDIMSLSVPRGGRGLDGSTIFSYFELGGIYVWSFWLCNIMRLLVLRGGWGWLFKPNF